MKRRKIVLNIPASVTPEMIAQLRAILEGPANVEAQAEAHPGEWMPGNMAKVGMEARILKRALGYSYQEPGVISRISGMDKNGGVCLDLRGKPYYHAHEIEVRWPAAAKAAESVEQEPIWRAITPEDVARIGPGDKLKMVKDVYLPAVSLGENEIVQVFENDDTSVPFRVKNADGKTAWISMRQALTCLPPAQKPEPELTPVVERDFVWRKVERDDVAKVNAGDVLRFDAACQSGWVSQFGTTTVERVNETSLDLTFCVGLPSDDTKWFPYFAFSRKAFGSWQPLSADNISRVKVGDRVRVDGERESATVTAVRGVEVQAIKDAEDTFPFFAYFDARSRQARFFIPDADNE